MAEGSGSNSEETFQKKLLPTPLLLPEQFILSGVEGRAYFIT